MKEELKKEFIDLLKSTNREGIEDLIKFMEEKTDFFTAPASTKFHGSYEGGLLEHSMKVYEILKYKVEHNVIDLKVPEEAVILVPLLHDICKVNFYKVDYRNAKNALGEWEKVPYYTVDDQIPYGHGEKSVMMLTEYIKLTPEEKYAIPLDSIQSIEDVSPSDLVSRGACDTWSVLYMPTRLIGFNNKTIMSFRLPLYSNNVTTTH